LTGHLPTRRDALITASGVVGSALGMSGVAKAAGNPRPPARRVLSLNPCLDEVLVQVADRSQIVALSHYARDPHASTIADIARTYPQTFESAEEVMMLKPDLVLASRHTSPATRSALTQFGVPLELFSVPNSIKVSAGQVMKIAKLVGHADRGAKLVAQIDGAVTAAAPAPGVRPITALVFQPRGFAAGEGTLINEMLTRTGFVNVAARYGIKQWGDVSLERLLADPPELLLSAEVEPGAPTWAERIVSHPALKAIANKMQRAVFPERLLYCGGPTLIQTAGLLAAARRTVEAHA
jgi:iron complex transport system substrate-binding protein